MNFRFLILIYNNIRWNCLKSTIRCDSWLSYCNRQPINLYVRRQYWKCNVPFGYAKRRLQVLYMSSFYVINSLNSSQSFCSPGCFCQSFFSHIFFRSVKFQSVDLDSSVVPPIQNKKTLTFAWDYVKNGRVGYFRTVPYEGCSRHVVMVKFWHKQAAYNTHPTMLQALRALSDTGHYFPYFRLACYLAA